MSHDIKNNSSVSDDNLELFRKLQEASKAIEAAKQYPTYPEYPVYPEYHGARCPHCGYCPHCGRSNGYTITWTSGDIKF